MDDGTKRSAEEILREFSARRARARDGMTRAIRQLLDEAMGHDLSDMGHETGSTAGSTTEE